MRGLLMSLVVLAVLAFAFAVGQKPQSNSKSNSTVDEAPKGPGDPKVVEEIKKNKVKPGSGDPPVTDKNPGGGAVGYTRGQISVHGYDCIGSCNFVANLNSCRVSGRKGFFYDDCSPRPNTDRLGNDCPNPCRWHFDPFSLNYGYFWCYSKSGTLYGCGIHQ